MSLPLLKVSVRMLLDLIKVLEADEKDFEIGCRCKDEWAAEGLEKSLRRCLEGLPVEVVVKEEKNVSIIPLGLVKAPTLLEG